jgi:hypothetical protein
LKTVWRADAGEFVRSFQDWSNTLQLLRSVPWVEGRSHASPPGLAATSMRTTALLSTAWAARHTRAGRAARSGWRRRLCARPCCCAHFTFKKSDSYKELYSSYHTASSCAPCPRRPVRPRSRGRLRQRFGWIRLSGGGGSPPPPFPQGWCSGVLLRPCCIQTPSTKKGEGSMVPLTIWPIRDQQSGFDEGWKVWPKPD